ncbi:MAG: hypothetical protein DBY43_05710 [Clostridiaceae bacterium]|nr:MAG: hypothetical protein DBY43_05710 [Clostridiaceae bacterium]
MTFAMILTESECSEMLEPLFHEVGHHEGIKLCDTELDNRPFGIKNITENSATAFIDRYGDKKRDRVFTEDTVELLLSEETVISIFCEALHLPNGNITHIEFCDNGLLLTLGGCDVKQESDTLYGGFATDMESGKEDLLFATQFSALLARNRAKEHAENQNAHVEDGVLYDTDAIITRKRDVFTLTVLGPWADAEV